MRILVAVETTDTVVDATVVVDWSSCVSEEDEEEAAESVVNAEDDVSDCPVTKPLRPLSTKQRSNERSAALGVNESLLVVISARLPLFLGPEQSINERYEFETRVGGEKTTGSSTDEYKKISSVTYEAQQFKGAKH